MTERDHSLTLELDGTTFAVAFDRYETGRVRYWWRVAIDSHGIADEGTDLSCAGEIDLADALRSLIVFVSDDMDNFPNLRNAGADLEDQAYDACSLLAGW